MISSYAYLTWCSYPNMMLMRWGCNVNEGEDTEFHGYIYIGMISLSDLICQHPRPPRSWKESERLVSCRSNTVRQENFVYNKHYTTKLMPTLSITSRHLDPTSPAQRQLRSTSRPHGTCHAGTADLHTVSPIITLPSQPSSFRRKVKHFSAERSSDFV